MLNCLAMAYRKVLNMAFTLTKERPDSADARLLIEELEALLDPLYAQESRHGYSVDKLLREKVVFFVVHHHVTPAACCGIQFFGQKYGELKRMYVRPQFRGQGLGRLMLNHLAEFARQSNVSVLRLETGIYQTEAIGLYETYGFRRIEPFGSYRPDPMSLFFELEIAV
ncbi:MAG: GNAT family N-acetyltransferase [Candidatus Promineifilaceae bacterium]|nr:GNAT family N-acetyltransferase [Candidatus Promineifilaceae bacterium]